MRHKFSLFAVVIILLVTISSCKQNVPQLALYIPKDAAVVFVVDTKSIINKISSSGITLDSIANMVDKNKNGLHWNDIQNSGIDLGKSFFVFTSQNNSMQSGKAQTFGLIAAVADKNKLESFLKNHVSGAQIKADNKYRYINFNNGLVAGWNDKILIISGVTTGMQNNPDEVQSHQQLTTLFTQTKSNSIASNSDFDDGLKKSADIHFWSNSSASLSALPAIGMTNMSKLLEDTYTEGTIDFENGKAVASAETHFNKTMSDILEKYPSKEIDKSMVSRYPEPVNGFGIFAFNPKVLVDILRYLGFDMMADSYTSQMGFTTADIVNAFSGDMAIMFSDFKMEDNAAPQMQGSQIKKSNSKFLLNLAIGDKAAFDKVMNGLVNKNVLSKNGDQYQLGMFGGHNFIIKSTGKNLLIGSDDALIKAYENGNNKTGLSGDVEKAINNKSMAVYVDIAAMLQKTNSSDTSSVKMMQTAQATFKNFIASADKSDNKSTRGNLELNFVNDNENSLASLVKFMAAAHEEEMKKKRDWNNYPPLSKLHDADSASSENDSQ